MRKLFGMCVATALVAMWSSQASATLFYIDTFNYPDGNLTTVSGGLWVGHSGSGFNDDIEVKNGNALVRNSGSEDANRQTGSIMGANDVWYYAATFRLDDKGASVDGMNEDYFLHFKDSGTFNFNARLLPTNPSGGGDYSLAIAASSLGDGRADWASDLNYGDNVCVVVEWNNGTGEATLWVNPIDSNSPSVTDDELADAMRDIESLAIRQDFISPGTPNNLIRLHNVSVATSWDEAKNALPEPASLALVGIGGLLMGLRRRTA